MKLCLIFNKAAHYRTAIYSRIDETYDCEWFLGHCPDEMSQQALKIITYVRTFDLGISHFTWQEKVVRLIFKKEYDCFLVLGELYSLSSWVIGILKKLFRPKAKLYFWTHGYYGKEGKLKLLFKRIYFSFADGVFTYGERARLLMIRQGFNPEKVIPIHNSLDYSLQLNVRNSLRPSSIFKDHFHNPFPVIVFIGRLTAVKRLDIMIEALDLLQQKGDCCNLVIVGEGPMRTSLEALTRDKGLNGNVWFYGRSFEEKINGELIFNSDICVSPGNVGLTAIHSLMYGTPVITHGRFELQMPEFEAIKKGVTGDFFEYGDKDSLVTTISCWLNEHKNKREEVRLSCYKEIDEKWNPDYQLMILKEGLVTTSKYEKTNSN